MGWPLSQDYNEAVQNAATCFGDSDLRGGELGTGALGIPIPRSGNFADVYQVRGPDGRRWAVKCFTRRVGDLQERYARIDAHLGKANLPFTVGFSFLPEGVLVRGQWYPVVKMEWVEGLTLIEFVREHLTKTNRLEALLRIWVRLARRLRDARITHADLQHGNVLLVAGAGTSKLGLKLIDYDGMWIPSLASHPSGEVGHPAYQHPARVRERLYSAEADRFPQLVVATALRGLIVGGPELWKRFDNGDNMLFREEDFHNPSGSLLMKVLWGLNDPVLRGLLGVLVLSLNRPLVETPWLDHLLAEGRAPQLTDAQERQAAAVLGIAAPPAARPRSAPSAPAFTDPFKGAEADDLASAESSRPFGRRRLMPILAAAGIAVGLVGLCIGIVAKSGSGPSAQPVPQQPLPATGADKEAESKKDETPAQRVAMKSSPGLGPEGSPGWVRSYQVAGDSIAGVVFLPPGRRAVEIDGVLARVWNLAAAKPAVTLKHPGPVLALAATSDGRYAVTGAEDNTLRVWLLEKEQTVHQFRRLDAAVTCCAVSPDDLRVLAVTRVGTIHQWDMSTGEEKSSFPGPGESCRAAVYSPDGTQVALATKDGPQIWDLNKRRAVQLFAGHAGPVNAVCFAPNADHLFSASDDKTVRRWSVTAGKEGPTFTGHADRVLSLALSKNGNVLAAGSADGTILLWDALTGKRLRGIVSHKKDGAARSLALSADGRQLLVGHVNGLMHLYRLARYVDGKPVPGESGLELVWQFPGGTAPGCLQFLPDGERWVCSPGSPAEVRWHGLGPVEAAAKAPPDRLAVAAVASAIGWLADPPGKAVDRRTILSLNVTPAGDVVSVPVGAPATVWDSTSFTMTRRLEAPVLAPGFLSVDPDGKLAVQPADDGTVRVISLDTGKPIAAHRLHGSQRVLSARYGTGGEQIVSLDQGGTIVVWTPRPTELSRFADAARAGRHVALSPSRAFVMAYGASDVIALYDALSGQEAHVFRGHTQLALDAVFAPDGRSVLSVGLDRTLRLWDVATGKQLHEAPLPDIGTNVRVSPDGLYALTSSGTGASGCVQLWRLPAAAE